MHRIDPVMLGDRVRVDVVGAGGNGSVITGGLLWSDVSLDREEITWRGETDKAERRTQRHCSRERSQYYGISRAA